MDSKFSIRAVCFIFWLALVRKAQGEDININRYGAKADGKSDDSQAITSAWKEACTSIDPSTVVIPKGKYMVGPVMFQGPCKASVSIQHKSQDGWIVFQNIDRLMVTGGGTFDGQGSLAWSQNNCAKTRKCNSLPINLRFIGVTNSNIQGIKSWNSKLFHMSILNCKNVTIQHVTINAPGESLNTDGIHIGRSTRINITHADIKTGDDCVSLGDGSQQINVEKVNCGPGHGIRVIVRNCTLTNTMNGVRVKTWRASPSGLASDLHFEDIIINNVSTPILIDQQYCPYGQCQSKVPSRVKISNVCFKNIRGTSATHLAVKLACSRGIPCQNVKISDINLTYNGNDGNVTSECANVNPTVSGKLIPPACAKSS
ncbi:exopolygalacturonase clone GBGA483-like [Fagus crenata]